GDQHAALWCIPRARHRQCSLRVREPARPHGEAARARPAGGAAREFSVRADGHGQRPDGELLWPARRHLFGWAGQRLGSWGRRAGRGMGLACAHYVTGASKAVSPGTEPNATVKIRMAPDGAIEVLSGAAEIGQGSTTMLAQTVAEVLDLELAQIRVVTGDSD